MALSKNTIKVVKQTIPALQANGEAITTHMYEVLFSKYPQTEPLFKNASNQNVKLAQAIIAYAQNIDQLENLKDAVEHITQRHVDTGVKPEHYDMVADALMTSMADILGDACTDEIKTAWAEAYNYLASIFKQREAELLANG